MALPQTWEEMWEICEKWVDEKGTPAYGHPIAGGYLTYYITVWGRRRVPQQGRRGCLYVSQRWLGKSVDRVARSH